MKKIILLTALMFTGMVSMAQNYLGKSLTEVKSILDSKQLYYEEYVNNQSTYSIKYNNDLEWRVYVFDYKDKCYSYLIIFDDITPVYNYAKQFAKQQFIEQERYHENIKWVFKKGKLQATCFYREDEEDYAILVENK